MVNAALAEICQRVRSSHDPDQCGLLSGISRRLKVVCKRRSRTSRNRVWSLAIQAAYDGQGAPQAHVEFQYVHSERSAVTGSSV
jgi:hypothetical protein